MSETKETKSGHAMRIAADIWERLEREASKTMKRTGKATSPREVAETMLREKLGMVAPS